MNAVAAGQKWSVIHMSHRGYGRMEFTIDSVDAREVRGTTPSGRKFTISLRVLRRGLRGAREVTNGRAPD